MKNSNKKFRTGIILGCMAMGLPALVFAGSNTNKGANPNGKPFIELAGEIIEVEGEVSTLQDQVSALITDVDDLDARITANEDAIADLQISNASLQAQIDANAADILSLQSQVDTLEADNADLQVQINALGDADGVLQAAIDSNSALITSLNISIQTLGGDLQAQIDNNNELITIIQEQIATLSAVGAERTRIENGVCQSGETVVGVNPSTGEFFCVRYYTQFDGTTAEMPVTYKTVSIGAGRTVSAYLGCEYHYPYYGFVANFSYSQTGGIEILQFSRYNSISYRYTLKNTTNELQTMNLAAECHQSQ